ncbi:unnamed protein product [Leptidea sinapis]|uniref:SREBP regulating gene protein n=1 Tax=Leptidea sinapis TaxID=189913 RepID=A0A5E4PXR2_9NEOP|nr:unnamed protein product [Leptidea sinapis]
MWYAVLLRFIRRPLVLGIIFASSLTYCIVSFLREGTNKHIVYQDVSLDKKPFIWRTLQEHNETSDWECRNSVQGKSLIVDDRVMSRRTNQHHLVTSSGDLKMLNKLVDTAVRLAIMNIVVLLLNIVSHAALTQIREICCNWSCQS